MGIFFTAFAITLEVTDLFLTLFDEIFLKFFHLTSFNTITFENFGR